MRGRTSVAGGVATRLVAPERTAGGPERATPPPAARIRDDGSEVMFARRAHGESAGPVVAGHTRDTCRTVA
ncbi:hypothetical protein CEP50_00605 [Actinopolyspora mortivallis]|uniref:Uncharacterized protein n=1 Tax=Actinopolyspora mortivallis TaxID=33906 RepID=A0A2T0H146_ACTMO|nr:hypothetical protein CEP50_00605 [Actinopolyspora mortivallis]